MTQPNDDESMIEVDGGVRPFVKDPIPLLVAAATSNDVGNAQDILREHPDVHVWMDPLIARLLPTIGSSSGGDGSTSSSSSSILSTQPQEALLVVGMLAQLDPEKYLLPIAKSFAKRVAEIARILVTDGGSTTLTLDAISPDLLKVWMQQLTQTSQVAVHSLLLQALIQAIQLQGPILAHAALQELAAVWQYHWSSLCAATNRETSSIVSVRCAATFVEFVVALGDVGFSAGQEVGATSLLTAMLQYDDPLLQLSILDLFPEHFNQTTTTELQGATRAWLASPEFAQPILDMLEDPLLEGPALQCASWISTVGRDDTDEPTSSMTTTLRTRVLHEIEKKGVLSSESDRLAVVQALVQLSKAAPSQLLEAVILNSEPLRCAWWDMTRLASPKLQAAILSSISQVLLSLGSSSSSSSSSSPDQHATIGTRLYSFLARDNRASPASSTDWLHGKYAKSPMPELRIATFAVWAAVAGLGSHGAMVLTTSSDVWQFLLEGGRETTTDARMAKYDIIQNLYQNGQGFLAKDLSQKLKKLLDMGPHGVPAARQWDVALE
jgi:hypothetical protein